jgi:hypothetical protein
MSATARATNAGMRMLAPAAAGLCLMTLTATAYAQPQAQPITSRPQMTWIGLGRPGDNSGSTGRVDRIGELALEPLRLALLAPFVPGPPNDAGCMGSSEHGSITGGSGLPSQHLFGTNLLGAPASWRTPRLTLFGFSRGGCPFDRAAGGGVTLVLPIRQDIFFVASGGAIYLPTTATGASASSSQVRGDIVFSRSGGRSFSVGVGTTRGGPSMTFAGVF